MQLTQRNSPHFPAENLPVADPSMITGWMGDCVSVIVLWSPGPGGRYANVRGYHGGGGIENVNFPSLFAGVPNLTNTLVFVVSGTLQGSHYASDSNRTAIRTASNAAGLFNAYIRCYHGYSNRSVDRFGNVT